MSRYGRNNCNHVWRYRKDGWEEECIPVICVECGAFGCICDVEDRPPREVFFGEAQNGDANINGNWENPCIEK